MKNEDIKYLSSISDKRLQDIANNELNKKEKKTNTMILKMLLEVKKL